jgi:hypothetical protein
MLTTRKNAGLLILENQGYKSTKYWESRERQTPAEV